VKKRRAGGRGGRGGRAGGARRKALM